MNFDSDVVFERENTRLMVTGPYGSDKVSLYRKQPDGTWREIYPDLGKIVEDIVQSPISEQMASIVDMALALIEIARALREDMKG